MFEKVVVEKVEVKNGRVWGVKTNQGFVQCEIFVNCAGQVSYHGAGCCQVASLNLILLPSMKRSPVGDGAGEGVCTFCAVVCVLESCCWCYFDIVPM